MIDTHPVHWLTHGQDVIYLYTNNETWLSLFTKDYYFRWLCVLRFLSWRLLRRVVATMIDCCCRAMAVLSSSWSSFFLFLRHFLWFSDWHLRCTRFLVAQTQWQSHEGLPRNKFAIRRMSYNWFLLGRVSLRLWSNLRLDLLLAKALGWLGRLGCCAWKDIWPDWDAVARQDSRLIDSLSQRANRCLLGRFTLSFSTLLFLFLPAMSGMLWTGGYLPEARYIIPLIDCCCRTFTLFLSSL